MEANNDSAIQFELKWEELKKQNAALTLELEAERAGAAAKHTALQSLFALVESECPSLLEDDHHFEIVQTALSSTAGAEMLTELRELRLFKVELETPKSPAGMQCCDPVIDGEIDALRETLTQVLGLIQTRLQPAGSPPGGGPYVLVNWITQSTLERLRKAEVEVDKHRQALTEIANTIDPVEGMRGGIEAVSIIISCIKSGMEAFQRITTLEAALASERETKILAVKLKLKAQDELDKAEVALEEARKDSLTAYLDRQWDWSLRTFGSGRRTLGVTRHIEKEIEEIRQKPEDLSEWIDVIILAMDGYWRHGGKPESLLADMWTKQDKNFARMWPQPTSEDEAVEHDRPAPERIERLMPKAIEVRQTCDGTPLPDGRPRCGFVTCSCHGGD